MGGQVGGVKPRTPNSILMIQGDLDDGCYYFYLHQPSRRSLVYVTLGLARMFQNYLINGVLMLFVSQVRQRLAEDPAYVSDILEARHLTLSLSSPLASSTKSIYVLR